MLAAAAILAIQCAFWQSTSKWVPVELPVLHWTIDVPSGSTVKQRFPEPDGEGAAFLSKLPPGTELWAVIEGGLVPFGVFACDDLDGTSWKSLSERSKRDHIYKSFDFSSGSAIFTARDLKFDDWHVLHLSLRRGGWIWIFQAYAKTRDIRLAERFLMRAAVSLRDPTESILPEARMRTLAGATNRSQQTLWDHLVKD